MNSKLNVLMISIVAALAAQSAPAHAARADTRSADPQAANGQTAPVGERPSQTQQTRREEAKNLATITVTATKRVELMQDVPISIDVVTANDIQTAGLVSAADIAMVVPGITMVPVQGPSTSNVVIRGLSETIGEPNVGFFVDGIYIPERDALDFFLADNIARVEIAKGPQYALYGRNTFAGAVNFITKAASSESAGLVRAGIGNHGEWNAEVIASGPFSKSSSAHYRIGVSRRDFDGFYRNELTGSKLDPTSSRGAFLTLDGSPTDRFNVRFNLIYDSMRRRDFAERYIENNCLFSPAFNDYQLYCGDVPSLTDGFAVTPGHLNRDSIMSSLKLDYDMDWARITSVSSYYHLKKDYLYDSDYSPAPVQVSATSGPQSSWSEDFRLISEGDNRIDWMFGLYYYHLEHDHVDTTRGVGPATALGGLVSTNHEHTRSAAAYGTVTWHMTPYWDLGLVARYTRETKSADVSSMALATGDATSGPVTPFHDSRTFTPFTPGVYLTWKPSRTATFYVSAVKAIKAGGFNTFTANGAIAPDERSYKAEHTMNYELGSKFSLLDGNMLLDIDIYQIKWRDQIVRTIGSMGALLDTNAGKTTSRGAELSLRYDPSRHWSLRLGYTYNDAKYDEYIFPILGLVGADPDLSGVRMQYAPQHTATLSIINRHPLGDGWTWTTRLDGRYQSAMAAVQTATATVPAQSVFNLHTSIGNDTWRFTLWSNNILNQKKAPGAVFVGNPATSFQFATGQRPGMSLFQAIVNAPALRTYGLNVEYRF